MATMPPVGYAQKNRVGYGKMSLAEIMDREWEDVRKGFYYPQLPKPRIADTTPNATISMESLQTEVNPAFIQDLTSYGISESEALNEVLTHEVMHFMKYPGSVLNVLRLQKVAMEYVDAAKASDLRTAYTEAQTNIAMVKDRKHPATIPISKGLVNDGAVPSPYGNLMWGLYEEVWNENLGTRLNRDEKALINKLKGINYLNKEDELSNFREFSQALKDYKPQQPKKRWWNKKDAKGGEQTGCQDTGIKMFTPNQIREGIKKFAQECDNPSEFETVVREVLKGRQEGQLTPIPHGTPGIHPGTDKRITILADNFYSALAEKYSIPIRKKPLQKNGSLYPDSHTSFSVGDSLQDLDPFSTPGILPGVTKKWVRKEGETATNYESVPHSMLIVDNSPSMFMRGNEGSAVSPADRVYQHIVGATAISNAYLDNNAKVAVYSFGSDDHLTPFTIDKKQIHRELRRYSLSGGTTFNRQLLEAVLNHSDHPFDISVISDMCISNLDTFITSMLNVPNTHRVHLLYANTASEAMGYVTKLRSKFGNKENIAILPLVREEDIKKIILGELTQSVR